MSDPTPTIRGSKCVLLGNWRYYKTLQGRYRVLMWQFLDWL